MSRTTSSSGPIAPFAPGNENYKSNVLFDATSTSVHSHTFVVDNNFVHIAAFNLAAGEAVTIEQVTGQGAGALINTYAPVNGPVKLYYNSATDQKTSHVLERAGRYRATLSGGGLGSVHVYAIQYFIENEASQDIADALYAVINELASITPCTFGAKIPREQPVQSNVVGLDENNCLVDFSITSIAPTPCSLGNDITDAVTAPDNYVGKDGEGCLVDSQLVSSGTGNLLQLRDDGLYYGVTPPANFSIQYVSSSTGNDSNAGTIGSPLATIQKAISNLPDGTMGTIRLLAGDVFHTYPTASGDVINTLTETQSFALLSALNINNRIINIQPYNDVAVDAIVAYVAANGGTYDPYIAAEIDFPVIQITLSLPTNSPTYVAIGFSIGPSGSLNFFGTNFVVGQTGTVSPAFHFGAIIGNGAVSFNGGNIIVGSVPTIGDNDGVGIEAFSASSTIIADHGTASTPPLFCSVGAQWFINTVTPYAGGSTYVPTLPYTLNGDNMETFLTPAALWPGIVIYSTAFRSFKKVITSIAIA